MPQGTPVKHKKKTKSILKNIRQSEHRAISNRINRTRVRNAIRRIRTALTAGDAAAAAKLVGPTFSEVDRGIRKHVLSENTGNRYKSRLTIALNALRAQKKS
ncbi:MAG: 30S ribosomal protein S20 [Candidatus Acidiferrales bacterium]|jgi:small subunit ribosomal protein S20